MLWKKKPVWETCDGLLVFHIWHQPLPCQKCQSSYFCPWSANAAVLVWATIRSTFPVQHVYVLLLTAIFLVVNNIEFCLLFFLFFGFSFAFWIAFRICMSVFFTMQCLFFINPMRSIFGQSEIDEYISFPNYHKSRVSIYGGFRQNDYLCLRLYVWRSWSQLFLKNDSWDKKIWRQSLHLPSVFVFCLEVTGELIAFSQNLSNYIDCPLD